MIIHILNKQNVGWQRCLSVSTCENKSSSKVNSLKLIIWCSIRAKVGENGLYSEDTNPGIKCGIHRVLLYSK